MAQVSTVDETLNLLATNPEGLTDGDLAQRLRRLVKDGIPEPLDGTDLSSRAEGHIVKFVLAPRFGKLDKEFIQTMDKALYVMVYSTIKDLDIVARGREGLTWKTMNEKLMQNACLETDPSSDETCPKIFTIDQKKPSALQDGEAIWFHGLVNDLDVIEATAISMDEVLKAAPEHEERRKFGVLRFPDITCPYIQTYHIQLFARTETSQPCFPMNLFKGPRDDHWIEGAYSSRKFQPRHDVIELLRSEVVEQAVAEVTAMLQDSTLAPK